MDGETCLWLAAHQNLTPLSAPTRSAGSSFDSREPTFAQDRLWRRIQLVNATDSLNISAGVLKPSVLRGLSFNCLAIALSFSWE